MKRVTIYILILNNYLNGPRLQNMYRGYMINEDYAYKSMIAELYRISSLNKAKNIVCAILRWT